MVVSMNVLHDKLPDDSSPTASHGFHHAYFAAPIIASYPESAQNADEST
jgi:hypothetical protein